MEIMKLQLHFQAHLKHSPTVRLTGLNNQWGFRETFHKCSTSEVIFLLACFYFVLQKRDLNV